MTYLKRFFGILAFAWLLAAVAFAQYNTVTSTTLSSAVAATDSIINVASATGITADPPTTLYIDREVMPVVSVSSTAITVRRTARATAHISGAVVWVGRPNWFRSTDPSGACTVTTEHVHPWVNTATGSVWYCSGGRWNPVGDNYVFISPGNCWMTAATTTISTGPALVRAAANNLVLSGTTNTTAGTLTVTCSIDPPMRTTTGKGPVLTDVYLLYGIQTTAMASIAAADIKSVTYPAAGGGGRGHGFIRPGRDAYGHTDHAPPHDHHGRAMPRREDQLRHAHCRLHRPSPPDPGAGLHDRRVNGDHSPNLRGAGALLQQPAVTA